MDKMNVSTYINLQAPTKRRRQAKRTNKEQENRTIMQDIVKINQNDNVAVAFVL